MSVVSKWEWIFFVEIEIVIGRHVMQFTEIS